MFADEGYIALRRSGAAGAELFSNVSKVLSRHHIVIVAVRHPSFTADQLIGAASDGFGALGSASFTGAPTVDIAPRATTKAAAVADEIRRPRPKRRFHELAAVDTERPADTSHPPPAAMEDQSAEAAPCSSQP